MGVSVRCDSAEDIQLCEKAAAAARTSNADGLLLPCEDALLRLEANGPDRDLAQALYWHSYIEWKFRNYATAENELKQSREIFRKQADGFFEMASLDLLATVYADAGRFNKARNSAREALALARTLDNPSVLFKTLGSTALMEWKAGYLKSAHSLFNEALQINHGHPWLLNKLGRLAMNEGRYTEALDHFRHGFNSAGDSQKGQLWISQAYVYLDLGSYEACVDSLHKAVAIFVGLKDDKHLADALLVQAELNLRMENSAAAQQAASRALELYGEHGNFDGRMIAQIHLAEAYSLEENHQSAIKILVRAAELAERSNIPRYQAYVWQRLGEVYMDSGDFEKAVSAAQKTVALYEKVQDNETAWRSQYTLGRAQSKMGKASEALTHYFQAMEFIESSRSNISEDRNRESFLSQRLGVYEETVRLLLETKDWDEADEAFRMSEKGKARGFLDSLSARPELSSKHREARNLLEARINWLREQAETPGNE